MSDINIFGSLRDIHDRIKEKRELKRADAEEKTAQANEESSREAAEMLRRNREAMQSRINAIKNEHKSQHAPKAAARGTNTGKSGAKNTPERLARILVFALGDKIKNEVGDSIRAEFNNPQNYTNRTLNSLGDKLEYVNKNVNETLVQTIKINKSLELLSKRISRGGSGTDFFPDGKKSKWGWLGTLAKLLPLAATVGIGTVETVQTRNNLLQGKMGDDDPELVDAFNEEFGTNYDKTTSLIDGELRKQRSKSRRANRLKEIASNIKRNDSLDNFLDAPVFPKNPVVEQENETAAKEKRIAEIKQEISVLEEGIAYHKQQPPLWQKRYENRYLQAVNKLADLRQELARLQGYTLGPKPRRMLRPKAISNTIGNMLKGMEKFAGSGSSLPANSPNNTPLYFMGNRASDNVEYRYGDNDINPTELAQKYYQRMYGGIDSGMGTYLAPQMRGQNSGFSGFNPATTYDGSSNSYPTGDPRKENDGRNGPSAAIARQAKQEAITRQRMFDRNPMGAGKNAGPANAFTGSAGKFTQLKSTKAMDGSGSALKDAKGRVISTENVDMPVHQRAFLDTLAMGNATSGGNYWESPDYNTIVGGQKFTDMSKHPEVFGTPDSTAAGRYQFTKTTWKDVVKRFNSQNPNNPIVDFSGKNQDRAAWFLAQQDYRRRTNGRDLEEDLKAGNTDHIKSGLGGFGKNTTWEILQKKSVTDIDDAYQANLKRNQGYSKGISQGKVDSVLATRKDIKPFSPLVPSALTARDEITNPQTERATGSVESVKLTKRYGPNRPGDIDSDVETQIKMAAKRAGIKDLTFTSGKGNWISPSGRAKGQKFTYHSTGHAVDISNSSFENDEQKLKFVQELSALGFNGFGTYSNASLHVDKRKNPSAWSWGGNLSKKALEEAAALGRELGPSKDAADSVDPTVKTEKPSVSPMFKKRGEFAADREMRVANARLDAPKTDHKAVQAAVKKVMLQSFTLTPDGTLAPTKSLRQSIQRAPKSETIIPPRQEDTERIARQKEVEERRERDREIRVANARVGKDDDMVNPELNHKKMTSSLAAVNRQSRGQNPASARSTDSVSGVKNMPTHWDKE